MARYIDAEKIVENAHLWHTPNEAYRDITLEPIDDDVVKVVRCKDCRYGHKYFDIVNGALDSWVECRNHDGLSRDVSYDGYCYVGER